VDCGSFVSTRFTWLLLLHWIVKEGNVSTVSTPGLVRGLLHVDIGTHWSRDRSTTTTVSGSTEDWVDVVLPIEIGFVTEGNVSSTTINCDDGARGRNRSRGRGRGSGGWSAVMRSLIRTKTRWEE
jgi:hypothetical protein